MARHGKGSQTGTRLWRVEGGRIEPRPDQLATEEPLEIHLLWEGTSRTVAVTMRTPGADPELALGFLYGEGIVSRAAQIARVGPCQTSEGRTAAECANIVEVELGEGPAPDWKSLERHFFTTSACGVCGKAGLENLAFRAPAALPAGPCIAPEMVTRLPGELRRAQGIFDSTGGLHAAALFDAAGKLLAVREDVGRHNAVDKLVGWALMSGRLPLHEHVVMVSGRSSYEILQKCLVAGVPVVCSVSAPSSLAVELAQRFGVTLIGFLRGDRFNVYSGIERIAGAPVPRAVLPVILTRP
ncbi:MAG: FdhD protein [Acidobacteriota bacterium]|nr:FdhD protein [Acidobacteriota bacterium]